MKYLCTQVEVAEQNCCLRAGNDQNNENQKEEAKHVVHLVRPAEEKRRHCVSTDDNSRYDGMLS